MHVFCIYVVLLVVATVSDCDKKSSRWKIGRRRKLEKRFEFPLNFPDVLPDVTERSTTWLMPFYRHDETTTRKVLRIKLENDGTTIKPGTSTGTTEDALEAEELAKRKKELEGRINASLREVYEKLKSEEGADVDRMLAKLKTYFEEPCNGFCCILELAKLLKKYKMGSEGKRIIEYVFEQQGSAWLPVLSTYEVKLQELIDRTNEIHKRGGLKYNRDSIVDRIENFIAEFKKNGHEVDVNNLLLELSYQNNRSGYEDVIKDLKLLLEIGSEEFHRSDILLLQIYDQIHILVEISKNTDPSTSPIFHVLLETLNSLQQNDGVLPEDYKILLETLADKMERKAHLLLIDSINKRTSGGSDVGIHFILKQVFSEMENNTSPDIIKMVGKLKNYLGSPNNESFCCMEDLMKLTFRHNMVPVGRSIVKYYIEHGDEKDISYWFPELTTFEHKLNEIIRQANVIRNAGGLKFNRDSIVNGIDTILAKFKANANMFGKDIIKLELKKKRNRIRYENVLNDLSLLVNRTKYHPKDDILLKLHLQISRLIEMSKNSDLSKTKEFIKLLDTLNILKKNGGVLPDYYKTVLEEFGVKMNPLDKEKLHDAMKTYFTHREIDAELKKVYKKLENKKGVYVDKMLASLMAYFENQNEESFCCMQQLTKLLFHYEMVPEAKEIIQYLIAKHSDSNWFPEILSFESKLIELIKQTNAIYAKQHNATRGQEDDILRKSNRDTMVNTLTALLVDYEANEHKIPENSKLLNLTSELRNNESGYEDVLHKLGLLLKSKAENFQTIDDLLLRLHKQIRTLIDEKSDPSSSPVFIDVIKTLRRIEYEGGVLPEYYKIVLEFLGHKMRPTDSEKLQDAMNVGERTQLKSNKEDSGSMKLLYTYA